MKYNAKDAISCLPEGTYPATVETATETTSKSGNEMIVLSFTVYKPGGGETSLKDYIVNPTGMWRLKKLAKAIGKTAEFESGEFRASDYVGCNLRLELEVEESDQYGDKNRIRAWLPSDMRGAAAFADRAPAPGRGAQKQGYEPISEDDIPF